MSIGNNTECTVCSDDNTKIMLILKCVRHSKKNSNEFSSHTLNYLKTHSKNQI